MRLFGIIAVLISVLIAGVILLPRLTGPKFYVVSVGEFGASSFMTNRFIVKSPSASAWFAYLGLVVKSGELEKSQEIEVTVFQSGKTVFRKVYTADELFEQNPYKRNSFALLLADAHVEGPPKKVFGYGREFEVQATLLGSSNQWIGIYAHFVDDRLIKN